MGLKESLKRLFTTSKTVGTKKVEQSIEQVKKFAKENSGDVEEAIDQSKESIQELARKAEEQAKVYSEKIQEKAEETKDQIETKIEEVWAKFEEKAVIVVDNLESKIRGAEPDEAPVNEPDVIVAYDTEIPVEPTEPDAPETAPEPEKSTEDPKV